MGFLSHIVNNVKNWFNGDSKKPAEPQRTLDINHPKPSTQDLNHQPNALTPRAALLKELLRDPARLARVQTILAKRNDMRVNQGANNFDLSSIASPRISLIGDKTNEASQRIIELQLDNGIRFVVAPDNSSNRVNLKAIYSVGSKDDKVPGTAHLLEHLLAGRTPYLTFREGEDMDIVKYNGGYSNAATNNDATWYDNFLPPELIELAFKIESERMQSANLDAINHILPIEKSVVEQEIKKYDDDATSVTSDALNALMYKDTRYEHNVLGTAASLKRISLNDLKNCYSQYQNPNKLTVLVSGNVGDPRRLEHLILSYFGNIKPSQETTNPSSIQQTTPIVNAVHEHTLLKTGATKTLGLAFEMPGIHDPDSVVFDILIYALAQSSTAIFPKKLNEDKLLGLNISLIPILRHGRSAIQLLFEANKFTDLSDLKKEVKSILEKIGEDGIEESVLAQVKRQVILSQYQKQENLELKSLELASLTPFKAWNHSLDRITKIQQITNKDIQRVVRKYLTKNDEYTAYLKPSDEKAPLDTTTQSFKPQPERVLDPVRMQELTDSICGKQIPQPPDLNISKTNDTNTTIICNENHRLPLANFKIFSPRPSLAIKDRLKMNILINMLALSGTQSYKREEWIQRRNDLCASLNVSHDADGFTLAMHTNTLGDNLKSFSELFKEFLLHPKLDIETFTKIKAEIKNAIKEEYKDAAVIADRVVNDAIYPEGHFLHRGNRESRWQLLDSISYEDVIQAWENLKKGPFIITASGDTNQEQIKNYFSTTVNQWSQSHNTNYSSNLNTPHASDIQQLEGYEFKGEQEQAHVTLGHDCNINESHQDHYAMRLSNLILGGDPISSRLGKLRENSGLVYNIRSNLYNSAFNGGPWVISAASQKSNGAKLLSTIKAALSGFPDNITENEVKLAKQMFIRSYFIDYFSTNSNKASTLLDLEIKGRDMNFIQNFATKINSITREQIINAFKQHIDINKLVEAVVDEKITVNGQEINTKFNAKEKQYTIVA